MIWIIIRDNLIFSKIKTKNKYNKKSIRINKYKDFKFKILNSIIEPSVDSRAFKSRLYYL